jgi:hypothetical protein
MESTTSSASSPLNVVPGNITSSWDDLSRLIEHFSRYNGHDWLFRGVTSSDHLLIPKVGRPDRKPKPTRADPDRRIPYSLVDEIATFRMFQDAARAHLEATPANELEWLALAQHFGVPTRLLDWTEGFLTATWFALKNSGFLEVYDEGKGRVVLRRHDAAVWVVRNLPSVSDSDKARPFDVAGVKCYRAPHISPRIPAQRSVFTLQQNPTAELTHPELLKITIRSKACFEIRKRLDACGVNENSLFPDLQGLGAHLAWRYKNNWLAGYRGMGNGGR